MKFLALVMVLGLQAQTPAPATGPSRAPWLPRPVIIVDPRPYLSSPSPHPKHRATPHPRATPARRRPSTAPAPETFERLDTSPRPSPPPRSVRG